MGLVEPRWGWRGANPESQGVITSIHADGEVRIAFFGLPRLWRGDPSDLKIEKMFEVEEWVRLKDNANHWKSIGPGSVGVVQGIGYENNEVDRSTFVGFCGDQEKWVGPSSHLERFGMANSLLDRKLELSNLLSNQDLDGSKTWMLDPSEVEVVEKNELYIGDWPFKVGDKVRIRDRLVTPRWGWGIETYASKGQVVGVDANGKLRIKFRWREGRPWIGDPADLALDEN
ncbi:hypothetical protein RJT34_02651 [Clitoria ternatea]|uniref:Mind bomb SH3 repeat domain-containing protein n=1 Tax=Clitoria ternatea TaxID=43366 RepID=A0AAN9KKR7_CLITE